MLRSLFNFKILLFSVLIVLANSADILYNSAYKFEFNPEISYLVILASIFTLASVFIKKTKVQGGTKKLLGCSLLYLCLQLINSIWLDQFSLYSLTAFACFFAITYFCFILEAFSDDNLLAVMVNVYFFTFGLYLACDVSSIYLLEKSQHVLLSNILPLQSLLLVGMFLLIRKDRIVVWLSGLSFLLFLGYIYFSAYYYTEDQRFQMKALVLIPVILSAYFTLSFSRFIFRNFLFSRATGDFLWGRWAFIVNFFIIAVAMMSGVAFKYFDVLGLLGRDKSGLLRGIVALNMFNEIFSSFKSTWFGFGIGSSISTYFFYDHAYKGFFLYKSHSGFASYLYEHGLLGFLISYCLVVFWIFSFSNKNPGGSISLEKNDRIFKSASLLSVVYLVWVFLNVIYLIAIPTANYVDHTQIYTFILLIYILKRSMGRSLQDIVPVRKSLTS